MNKCYVQPLQSKGAILGINWMIKYGERTVKSHSMEVICYLIRREEVNSLEVGAKVSMFFPHLHRKVCECPHAWP